MCNLNMILNQTSFPYDTFDIPKGMRLSEKVYTNLSTILLFISYLLPTEPSAMAPTKEGLIKTVLRNLVKLQNEFHGPLLFCYYSKLGIVPFGSKNLVKKVLDELKDEENEDGDSNVQS